MEPFRLKMKIGPHEFESEGDQESVERQFAIWRELIASPSASPPAAPSPPPAPPSPERTFAIGGLEFSASQFAPPPKPQEDAERREYAKIFKHDGRIVSLTVQPQGAGRTPDALLVLLLGHFVFNGPEPVTGQQLSDGMRQSGIPVDRVDRSLGLHADVNVLKSGVNRGIRYRLSNAGMARAKEIAKELLGLVV